MKSALEAWTIRAFEKRGQINLLNYLINFPDRTQKQTLCVMPDLRKKPTSALKMMEILYYQRQPQRCRIKGDYQRQMPHQRRWRKSVPVTIRKDFRTWKAFILWTQDIDKLRMILAFYNIVNHFALLKPRGRRTSLPLKYGCPPPRRKATGVAENRVKLKNAAILHVQYGVSALEAIRASLARLELNCTMNTRTSTDVFSSSWAKVNYQYWEY